MSSIEIRTAKLLDYDGIFKILADLGYPQNNDQLFLETLKLILSNSNMGVLIALANVEANSAWMKFDL